MKKQTTEWFAEWFDSTYYHRLYANRDHKEAASFVTRLLTHLDLGQRSQILDLACGKGRHSIQMASMGHEVVGLDLSANSIAHCQASATEHLSFTVHDMREVYRPAYFDLIVNLFTSFGYFDAFDDNLRTLRAIAEGLVSTGRFVIDFLNVTPVIDSLPRAETIVREDTEFHIEKRVEDQKIIKEIRFEADGQQHHHTERVQALVLSDFKKLLAQAGLQIDELYGDYDLAPFDEASSPRLILIGSKA